MNELALFAGAGGGILGSRLLGWRTVCAVEIEPYCRRVLMQRQNDGMLDPFPIWDDVRTFDGTPWRGKVDVVTAGFPCQPFSLAGKQQRQCDERNLWPDTLRVLREIRPRYALLENVPGLVSCGYLATILRGLAEGGYDAEWGVFSASDAGAPHIRKRLWVLAYTENYRIGWRKQQPGGSKEARNVAYSDCERCSHIQGRATNTGIARNRPAGMCGWWDIEPAVGRVADGLANRVDRLKALGNGQVPRVVVEAWSVLRG